MSRHPWDKREDETAKAYAGFSAYLELGRNRTLLAAYRQYKGKPGASNAPGFFNRWSAQHDWVARAEAWDTWQLSERIDGRAEAIETARQVLVEETGELVGCLLRIAKGEAITLVESPDGGLQPVHASMVELVAIRDALDRAGLTKPEKLDIRAKIDTGPDLDEAVTKLSDEQLEAILALDADDAGQG